MSAEDREQDIVERYPHFKTYQACQSAAFFYGSLTFAGAAAVFFVGFDLAFKKFKPNISKNWNVAFPILGASIVSYMATMRRTSWCSNMWMAMEERHSALTPAEDRLAERLKLKESEDK